MEAAVYQFELALRYPFAISRHTYHSMKTMILELSAGRASGYGEATTNPYYQVTEDKLLASFSEATEFIKDYTFKDPETLWIDLNPILKDDPFAQSAIDCAAHDLYNKLKGRPFKARWGIMYEKYPLTSYTLGIGTIDELKRKMLDLNWPIYKVKTGGRNDGRTIQELRKHTDAVLRVDANCSWSNEDAPQLADELHNSGVEFIEQPFKADQYKQTSDLRKKSSIPILADESCRRVEDIEKCIGNFDGINIKLAKCGGLTPALEMVDRARRTGLKVMIGCMTETTVGISAAAQLLPLVDYADLDGPLLLLEDVATGLNYYRGSVIPGKTNGLGFRFEQQKFSTELPSR
jgi:L-alanine-DL-glutamate epimerase-like enolase superfamily enzyme